jgi:hypothetical protein
MASSSRNSAAALVSEIKVAMPSLAVPSQAAQSDCCAAVSRPLDLVQGTSWSMPNAKTATSINPRQETNSVMRGIIVRSMLHYPAGPSGRADNSYLVRTCNGLCEGRPPQSILRASEHFAMIEMR